MCRMTDTGARWARNIDLPPFGLTTTYWAVPYGNETRYVREPEGYHRKELRDWFKPMYAIRVTARTI